MKIYTMPDILANKIAAGEVVERPASVVKELVENSIDAGSTTIKVEVEEAGLRKIKITDNGSGMSADDCERAFLRHATSKIRSENDLFHVKTLGFRGEALASIAAVSRLTIKTSTGEEAGTQLILDGGKIVEKDRTDARQGTEISVEHLFYNTPARLKHMKTIHTELGHITDVMNRLSLANPHIRFELYHNDKQLFQSNGRGDLIQIIAQIYGVSVAKKMLKIECKTLDYQITGYISKPEVTRSSRNYMSTIINGRYIRSIPLNHAILKGYHTLLPIGKSPIVVLQIEMDPILVDVNVHPAKLEVRFSKERELYQAIEETVREVFRKETLIPRVSLNTPKHTRTEQESFQFEHRKTTIQDDSATQTVPQKLESLDPEPISEPESNQANEDYQNYDLTETTQQVEVDIDTPLEKPINRVPVMYPIGQHHGTYIIAENEQGLYLIDQHAAQERIKYEYFRDKIGEVDRELQQLLVPLTFDFSQQEALVIEQYQAELEYVGLYFEHFGQSTYLIRSHPTWFPVGEEEEIIRDMVDQIIRDGQINISKLREEAAILMSCKRSIKANHHLNKDDMFKLLEDLRGTEDPFTCPHGRPIIIHFSSYEMEKLFKRVM
ncbi:DNA mismatch repair endonuclease MutL [Amphibacillus xylanus]|uniref:DNA mismatch repair protein MutL n=1 Tax=Amphibacillus xylanus (strain ATCC 51415 / DSM 6626 / JCM 7361 / LMG 17667 / NBRC 15112 / Ep01) TaxID=698758 RepID=K0J7L1_AMPXN|nr:DNA mismatch repair endonuclease MutL [Amphibacillus xylanus]BAM47558.1 DNA mismatch repair protein MutL [Amphibacillus xylanus NBRC 15112]